MKLEIQLGVLAIVVAITAASYSMLGFYRRWRGPYDWPFFEKVRMAPGSVAAVVVIDVLLSFALVLLCFFVSPAFWLRTVSTPLSILLLAPLFGLAPQIAIAVAVPCFPRVSELVSRALLEVHFNRAVFVHQANDQLARMLFRVQKDRVHRFPDEIVNYTYAVWSRAYAAIAGGRLARFEVHPSLKIAQMREHLGLDELLSWLESIESCCIDGTLEEKHPELRHWDGRERRHRPRNRLGNQRFKGRRALRDRGPGSAA